MHQFPRPSAPQLVAERTPADGACAECGTEDLASYRVLGDGGWWDVVKCQTCLASQRRTPAPRFGDYVPLGLTVGG